MASRNIIDCVPELQGKWPLLKKEFEAIFPGWSLILTCTYRSPEEQFDLFKKGRREVNGEWVVDAPGLVVTYVDGKSRLSEHNYRPARAFDVVIVKPDGKMTWELQEPAWQALPKIVQSFGLESGGTWTKFKDFPHVQVSKKGWV